MSETIFLDNTLDLALKQEKEREILLKIENELTDFLSQKEQIKFEKKVSSKYHRLLIHTLAKRFNIDSKTEKIEVETKMILQNNAKNMFIDEEDYKVVFIKNESSQIPSLRLSYFLESKNFGLTGNNDKNTMRIDCDLFDKQSQPKLKNREKLNKEDIPTIKGRGNFMWISQNEMETQDNDEIMTRFNKLNIYDDEKDDRDQTSRNVVKFKLSSQCFDYIPKFNTDNSSKGNNNMKFQNKKVSNFDHSKGLSYSNYNSANNSYNIHNSADHLIEIIGLDNYNDIHDVHRFVLNELNANNIYDNFKIKKLNNTYIIICPSVQIAEKLLQINTERFKLRSVHQDSKDIKIEVPEKKLPSINIKAFQRMIQSHLNTKTKV